MKVKLFLFASLFLQSSAIFASHLEVRNAGKLTIGIIPNERMDKSSVTMLGPTIEPEELSGGASTFLRNVVGVTFSSHIADGSLGGADIASNSIGSSQTVTGALLYNALGVVFASHTGTAELLRDGVGVIASTHIAQGVLRTTHTASGEFLWDRLRVITSTHIAQDSIGAYQIAPATITNAEILDGTIISDDIGNSQIIATKIAADAVTTSKILDGTIGQADIAAGNVLFEGVGVIFSTHTKTGELIYNRAGVIVSSMIAGNLTSVGSFTVTASSWSIGGLTFAYPSTAPANSQIMRYQNGFWIWSQDISGFFVENARGVIFSSMTSGNWTSISSFTVTGASLVVNGITYAFPSTAPVTGQVLRTRADNTVFWGGDLDTSGGVSGESTIGSTVGINPYLVVVGTLGALNVNIASNTEDGLVAALDRVGAAGMTTGTSVQATIVYKEGLYQIKNATVPAGIKIWAVGNSSKTVWQLSDPASTLLTNYGEVDGLTFSSAAASLMVVAKSNSRMRNFSFINGMGLTNDGFNTCQLCVISATNVRFSDGNFENFLGRQGFVNGGDAGTINVRYSRDVLFDRVNLGSFTANPSGTATNNFTAISFFYSDDVIWKNSHFSNIAGRFFINVAGRNNGFKNNTGIITGKDSTDVASRGYFSINMDHTAQSTAPYFIDNDFTVSTGVAGTVGIFSTEMAAGARVTALNIKGNRVIAKEAGNSVTMINLQDVRAVDTVIQNNFAVNVSTFISDTGTRTSVTGLGNVLWNPGGGVQKF